MSGYLVLDTETTGLPDWRAPADAAHQPRLASCMIWVNRDLDVEHSLDGLVRPDGWEMSPGAQRVNGLSTERLKAEGATVVWPLSLYRRALDSGRTLVCHNVEFDERIMRGELLRAGMPGEWHRRPTLCTMRRLTYVCGIEGPRGDYKWPRLSEAYQALFEEPLEGAHGAKPDAFACLRLLRWMHQQKMLREAA